MQRSPKQLWEECLRLIRNNVREEQYTTWFAPLRLMQYDAEQNLLLVSVPSPFVYEYIEENFVSLMSKVLRHCFGRGVQLSYRVLTDSTNDLSTILPGNGGGEPIQGGTPTAGSNVSPTALDGLAPQDIDPQLNPAQTFATFIEGRSNKLPRAVGMAIADNPTTTQFNPMFVYGPSGCGKTHLINAIGMHIKQRLPHLRVLYVSARLFQVQYVDASKQNTVNDFIRFYQSIDVLIIDDVQEWVTAKGTQNTFFHILNHLFRNGKRIILASDRPPVDLDGMDARLITRFSCGLIAEIEKPDTTLCIDILHHLIRKNGLKIGNDVIEAIAHTANNSVRDLEGIVASLMAYSVVYNSEIDLQLAQTVISRSVKMDNRPVTVDDIVGEVCQYYHVSSNEVQSRSRKRALVEARQVCMYLTQKHTKMPAARIGKLVGGRDHSTVLYSVSLIEQRLKNDRTFSSDIENIERKLLG